MDPVNIVLAIIIVVIVVLLYFKLTTRLIVYRFHRPTCGFCKSTQDDWNKFRTACMLKKISCREINMDEASAADNELFKKYGGTGVPYIVKVYNNGNYQVYSGDRSAASLKAWVVFPGEDF